MLPFPTIARIKCKNHNLTTIVKKLRSSFHGEIQLKLFDSEAAPNPTLLEKQSNYRNGEF